MAGRPQLRSYSSTPGYYYLHRAIPLYDAYVGRGVGQDLATLNATVSHVLAAVPDLVVPGYTVEREFGNVRILRRDAAEPPVRQWREHAPVIVFDLVWKTMQQIDADFPAPPTVGAWCNAVAVGARCTLRGTPRTGRGRGGVAEP